MTTFGRKKKILPNDLRCIRSGCNKRSDGLKRVKRDEVYKTGGRR